MAEALVSKVLEQLASIMHQQAEERIKLIVSVDEEVGKLTRNFRTIQAVLIDAEKKQVKETAVRDWLDEVKDISYDVDDVLDEWNTMIQKLQTKKAAEASKPLRKVCPLIPKYICCWRTFVLRDGIAVKIRNLDRKLDIIAREKDRFQFSSITKVSEEPQRYMTTSIVDITEVHGRDEEKNRLLDLLLRQTGQEQVIPILSIVGLAGIGKTTLARLVFNDNKVKTHFDLKIWVHVSECFDEIRIAREILKSLGYALDIVDPERLLQKLCQHIETIKFLLILDDVCAENLRNWEQLKHILNYGSQESRILVTTRQENIANVIGTTYMMTLTTLFEEECWLMFSKIAFFEKTREECDILTETGKNIVKKRKGLPLATKLLASLLRFKREIKEWQDVLDSEIWEIEEVEHGFLPSLLFNYYDLPPILKKCFSYCAIFLKDYETNKDELIKLWIAQDYLKAENNKDVELVGEDYCKILVIRSFFQDLKKDLHDDILSFKMHDVVHNFAQFLTRNECFIIEEDGYGEFEYEPSYKKSRHSMTKVRRDGSFSNSIYTQKFLHSLLVVSEFGRYKRAGLSKLFGQLTCLRTLNLSNQKFSEISAKINKLIHLRYLNLSQNWFSVLPESICELYNLQILDIGGCQGLRKLPEGIGNLINLRCLENSGTRFLRYMPKSFEKLTGLRRLGKFVISEDGYSSKACSVECLKNFNHLQEIRIKGLGNSTDVGKADEAQLYNKKNLRVLYLNFGGSVNQDHVALLEALEPPPNLDELQIKYYNDYACTCAMFPGWIMSLTKLRKLIIQRCDRCEHLYCLGKLSSLESLQIGYNQRIKKVGDEFLGIETDVTPSSSSAIIFPELKFLWFHDMEEWEEWNYEIKKRGEEEITIMPCLQTLKIENCPKLESTPNHLRNMTMLKMEIRYCRLLKEELEGSDKPSSSAAVTN